jgi:hypothetical protein
MGQPGLGPLQIAGRGDLEVRLGTREDAHLSAQTLNQRGFVCDVAIGALKGTAEKGSPKDLGCLHTPDFAAWQGFKHHAIGYPLDCVPGRDSGDGCLGSPHRVQREVDQLGCQERAGSVMDEDPLACIQRFQTSAYRVAAVSTSLTDHRRAREASREDASIGKPITRDHDRELRDLGTGRKHAQGMGRNRSASQGRPNLIEAHPTGGSRGDQHRANRVRHDAA